MIGFLCRSKLYIYIYIYRLINYGSKPHLLTYSCIILLCTMKSAVPLLLPISSSFTSQNTYTSNFIIISSRSIPKLKACNSFLRLIYTIGKLFLIFLLPFPYQICTFSFLLTIFIFYVVHGNGLLLN